MDIEKLLENGSAIQFKPQGWSMYPLITYGRDEVIVEPVDGEVLKRADVVLYRRDESILVLHRILKCTKEGVYLVGDNQVQIEGPLRYDQIKGRMTGFIRNGKRYTTNNVWYKMYSVIWLWLRPFRPFISKSVHKLKKMW